MGSLCVTPPLRDVSGSSLLGMMKQTLPYFNPYFHSPPMTRRPGLPSASQFTPTEASTRRPRPFLPADATREAPRRWIASVRIR